MILIPDLRKVTSSDIPASAALLLIAIAHTSLGWSAHNVRRRGWSAEKLSWLAKLAGLEYTTALRNMNMLVERGLVRVEPNERDHYKPWRQVVALATPTTAPSALSAPARKEPTEADKLFAETMNEAFDA